MAGKPLILFWCSLFFIFGASAQIGPASYDATWKKIDSLIDQTGQAKTALKKVNTLYARAKKENNDPQLIKALIYRANLNEGLTDNNKNETFAGLGREITTAKEPARSILQSILASAYWNFLQRNRYRFYNRTATVNFVKDDPATWGIDDLNKKISALYLGSVSHSQILQATKPEPFDAIINKGNARRLRPTLFDLLAHRALDYFENDERNVTRPAYAFEISDTAAFANASTFIDHRFTTQDTSSLHFQALLLFQQLLGLHLNDPKPDALIDADIRRIEFVHANSVSENKETLYQSALEKITGAYPGNATATQAVYLLASQWVSKAESYDPLTDTTNRYAYLKAKVLCEQALQTKDSSEGRANCANLIRQIDRQEIKTDAEEVNVPGAPFRMLATYRNVSQAYFRIVHLGSAGGQEPVTDRYSDTYWQTILAAPALKSFSNTFPDTKDHQNHRAEIKIDALPPGKYALIISTGKDFSLQENLLALQSFYVSNIAYVRKNTGYYVLDRQTGAPLARAAVQLWNSQYDYRKKQNVLLKGLRYSAGADGYFQLNDSLKKYDRFFLDISYKNDRLYIDEQENSYTVYGSAEPARPAVFLFTDRSIYRPGQLLYFKGIVVTRSGASQPQVSANRRSVVKLYDANGQVADSLFLQTNEFGSYAGKFTLPAGRLNGEFFIRDETTDGQASFRVEEYKRPRFSVEIKKPAGTYRLQDTVRVEGAARAFAGNDLDGAAVSYRVTRKMMVQPYQDFFKIRSPYRYNEMEIAHGTATTGANGKFMIAFQAKPDKSIAGQQTPLFNYEVTADVTDINGETRSGSTNVGVGVHALKLHLDMPGAIHTDSLKNIPVSTTNMNDVFEKAMVRLSIQKLAVPERQFRERYWQQPDQFIMSREAYYHDFPFDPYSDETDRSKWPVEKIVFETSGATASESGLAVRGNFTPGWYLVEASATDRFNDTVSEKRYIRLYNDQTVSPFPVSTIQCNKTVAQPGDQIYYQLLTNIDSVYLVQELTRKTGSRREVVPVLKNIFKDKFLVSEADRGDVAVNLFFVRNNRVYSRQQVVNVPYFNKQLKIEYTSFRDKVLPGTREKWKVKISGYRGEKLAAELLTSMYDASLDQFSPHSWAAPSLWYEGQQLAEWTADDNFQQWRSFERRFENEKTISFEKEYDQLQSINNGGIRYDLEGRLPGIMVQSMAPMKKEVADQVKTAEDSTIPASPPPQGPALPGVQPRSNLNETAFFFPDLHTDTAGNVEFSFTTPEALTTWKWMLLAHTRDLAFGAGEKILITQKELMVQPNAPRFLREGDRIDFTAKIVNMTDKPLSGTATLQLTSAMTGENLDSAFLNQTAGRAFTAGASQSVPLSFRIIVPKNFTGPLSWRIVAAAGSWSDGEEAMLPVISNRMLVTETLLLPVKGNTTKNFRFDKLLVSGTSGSLQQKGITVEFTSNPAWYAVQALPYLAEGEKENAEQLFNQFYANALAAKIAGSSPRFRQIIDKWKADTTALLSNLQKNEAFKSVLLRETPWVLEGKTETQQKNNIALLFDMSRMSSQLSAALTKLKDLQAPTGGFVWFRGGPEDRYMTQYILSGIGRLKKLGAIPQADKTLQLMIRSGLFYLDQQIKNDYDKSKKTGAKLPSGSIENITAQYLYMRSFFVDESVPGDVFAAYNYYRNQSRLLWSKENSYIRGMIAVSLFRTGDILTAQKIIRALKETTIVNEELGTYWKDMNGGYYWYQAPVEAQSLLIETFAEMTKETSLVNDLKTWLLKNKQTNNWKTSRATADACYALLLQGSDWTARQPSVGIRLGDKQISSANAEAGTGYFKQYIPAEEVKPALGNVSVALSGGEGGQSAPAWGSVYWQYLEDLDKITSAASPLQLSKKLFIEKNTSRGPVLEPLDSNRTLHTGDRIRVRIELRSDRTLEYVHLKDMRASCLEPVNVLSGYKWQDGLGYYESTKDASTDFFFGVLPKGVFVFEYGLFVGASGAFSNGISTVQCLYAPEFTGHSEGVTLHAENK